MNDFIPFQDFVVKQYVDEDDYRGSFARHLQGILVDNPLEESFDDYNDLKDWQEHLELHDAPEDTYLILKELYDEYEASIPKEYRS